MSSDDATNMPPPIETGSSDVQYQALFDGFMSLREGRHGRKEASIGVDPLATDNPDDASALEMGSNGEPLEKESSNCVTVNFIDPTSAAYTGPTPKHGKVTPPMELYERLATLFHIEFGSTLYRVPYKHIRSGRNETISELPVKFVLTRSHGGTGPNGDAMVPWGGNAGTAPVTDPAEWHNGPFCHVYIAACENLQHYRSKVRPSVQAFVSQIEGAANNPPHGSSKDGSGAAVSGGTPHFVIVFVPTGSRTIPDASADTTSPANRMSNLLASRIATARQRMTASRADREVSNDSVHSVNTSMTDHSETDDPLDVSTSSGTSQAVTFSKQDKDLYRKFVHDFPSGSTCMLSTLLDLDVPVDEEKYMHLRKQEWGAFMRVLGSAIVDGFKDRCRRYDEEMRRLQSLPMSAPTRSPKFNPRQGSRQEGEHGLDLSYFFLVKESLAFTYEQMHLPAEALLQYEELRAFLPEPDEARPTGSTTEASAEDDDDEEEEEEGKRKSSFDATSSMDLAVAGDTLGFRRRVRSMRDLAPWAHIVQQYIFSREVSLLFKMAQPVELIRRCLKFAKTMHSSMVKAAEFVDDEPEMKRRFAEAEKWALGFCWDVRSASDNYFAIMPHGAASSGEFFDESSRRHGAHDPKEFLVETSLARELTTLLEFGRIRLLRLGDSLLPTSNPVRELLKGVPEHMMKPWDPWDPSIQKEGPKEEVPSAVVNVVSDEDSGEHHFLVGAFVSDEAYITKYTELTSSIINYSVFAGRHRIAAQLQGEVADIHMKRGNDALAIKALISAVNTMAKDHWDKCHFWHLLRLASCQRRSGTSTGYLKTLVNCFGPNIANVAPAKALGILLRDLEAVVGDGKISGARFRGVPFLATKMEIERTSAGESSIAFGPDRKQLNKKFCVVGETVRISLLISSFLPEAIEVDTATLSLVAFGTFAGKVESRTRLDDEDTYKTLSLGSTARIEPGINTFKFDWVPINTGQYILAATEVKWKHACFFYDSYESRRSLVGIDVLPSDPSQSITLEPYFLLPSHVQPVRIIFYSGSDVINRGTVHLECSMGIELTPPGMDITEDNWTTSCTVDLPPCGTGETTTLVANVRTSNSQLVSPDDDIPAIHAKVATLYRHADYVAQEKEDEANMPCMKTVLEAMVPTLDKPVLTVDTCNVFPFSLDTFLLSITLQCNSPVPYTVKSWKLNLPPPLLISNNGDLNMGLFDVACVEGEILSFGFNCKRGANADETAEEEPTLHLELEDEFGTLFEEDLPLNLRLFYAQLRRDSKLAGLSSVAIELQQFEKEGLVGDPVNLKYSIDLEGLKAVRKQISSMQTEMDQKFLYSVSFDEADWVIGGNVKGKISFSDESKFYLDLVGIPTRPGAIKGFPTVSIYVETDGGDLLPVTVDFQHPDKFNSHAFSDHMAAACPQQRK